LIHFFKRYSNTMNNSNKMCGMFITLFLFFVTGFMYLRSEIRKIPPVQIESLQSKPEHSQSLVIYNRVPKTGSTSLMNVLYELYSKNSFRVVQLHVTQFKHLLTVSDQITFAKNMSGWDSTPTVYHGHFAYFDPRRVGVDLSPVYINLVRKPLDRLVSHYYFLRYGDDVLVNKVRAKEGDTTTFDECVEKSQNDCDPKRMWIQIPFFCGTAPQCWDPGSEWALAQAKSNLVNKYLLVGVTEELDSFVEVLEELIPRFFSGATQFLSQSGKSHIKRTRHKDSISDATIHKLTNTKIWKLENEFYNFAIKNFHAVRNTIIEKKKLKSTFYKYEKVRPKT